MFIARYRVCPLCGDGALSRSFSLSVKNIVLSWDVCGACGLTFQNPRLSKKAIASLYERMDYFGRRGGESAAYHDYVRYEPLRLAQSRRRLARIKAVTGITGGRLLDVGSASGFFGATAKQQGFAVTCVEPDRQLADYGRQHYGLDFEVLPIEDCDLPPRHFDLVTIWGSDSTLLHPLHSFEIMAAALRPGGVLALSHQAFDHWLRWFIPSMKRRWNAMFNNTNRSIDVLFAKLGFELLARELEWQTVSLDHLCHHLSIPAPGFLRDAPLRVPAVSFPLVIARLTDTKPRPQRRTIARAALPASS